MNCKLIALAACATAAAIVPAVPAQARGHGRIVSVHGPGGHGYTAWRSVNREPGSRSVHRGVQTASGRGITSTRNASWGDGSYSGGATHTLNNGKSFGRTTTASANGDGTADYTVTRTGLDGHSRTVSGTVGHAED